MEATCGLKLCENLCEKIFPKSAQIGKSEQKCGNSKFSDFSKLI